MPVPLISVLMPVYNGKRFLQQAIDSILGQSFHNFELIVVDDGSTDATPAILARYTDSRLVVIRHESNQGVIAARNSAVCAARGKFFAMMDSDDVSHPERLMYQVEYLKQHPECGVVASRVILVDEEGRSQGRWDDDWNNITSMQIRNFLPRANCIGNSSVMLRADLLRGCGYICQPGVTEDYDLWLRLAADGVCFAKLEKQLLYYRLTPGSLTSQQLGFPSEYQQIRSKKHFLAKSLRQNRWGRFAWQVTLSLGRDLVRLLAKKVFRLLTGNWPDDNRDMLALQLSRTPLIRLIVRLSAFWGAFIPAVNRSGLFFFFPFFHTGGAERVHSDIVNCFNSQKPWVVFTKKSSSRDFYSLFDQGARLFNLWPICKYLYPFSAGIAAGFINRHKQPVVFGSNSLFYALLLPFLKPNVRCIDLVHAFGGGVETYTLPSVTRLDCRVAINQQTRHDLVQQYAESGLDAALAERIVLIPNRVPVPSAIPVKKWNRPLQVLFVGRGSEEKRVHLIGRTARRCMQEGLQVNFMLVGAGADSLDSGDEEYCTVAGHIGDTATLSDIYAAAHLIVITSSREGFPLTVMEGMAQGCVPVCTAVGGIPEHIRHQENGWLLPADDEAVVVSALFEAIVWLNNDRTLLKRLSLASHNYALKCFGGDDFYTQYHAVVLGADCRLKANVDALANSRF